MLLLPGERDLPPAEIGLRLVSREAAMRAGRPYAVVGQAPVTGFLPWYVWVGLGVGAAWLVWVAIRTRPTSPTSVPAKPAEERGGSLRNVEYVLVDRDRDWGGLSAEHCAPPASYAPPLAEDALLEVGSEA